MGTVESDVNIMVSARIGLHQMQAILKSEEIRNSTDVEARESGGYFLIG